MVTATKLLQAFTAPSDRLESLGHQFREKRFADFERLFSQYFPPTGLVRILDLGGKEYFWEGHSMLNNPNISITLLNLEADPVYTPYIRSVVGNATNLAQYEDGSFDLVFSNSVIEHLHTWQDQKKMAQEVQRVGKKYYIQTPNKYFFMEPHYALPFAQFLPRRLMYWLLTETSLSRSKKWLPEEAEQYVNEIRLLSKSELHLLFPEAKIYYEKFAGMNKSFTAHNF